VIRVAENVIAADGASMFLDRSGSKPLANHNQQPPWTKEESKYPERATAHSWVCYEN
jgi:hypothetical protein